MRFRKLRIAWSVFWGLASMLLLVLSVRSSFIYDNIHFPLGGTQDAVIGSDRGRLGLVLCAAEAGSIVYGAFGSKSESTEFLPPISNRWEFIRQRKPAPAIWISVPHWFVLLLFVAASAIVWPVWRFSLRTLLIATTLVAVVLGLIVWLNK